MHSVSDLIPKVVAIMRSEDVPVREGVPGRNLDAFEERWRVGIPSDMRNFYTVLDGTGKDVQLTDELFCIWPLANVMPIPVLLPEPHYEAYRDIEDADRYLCFADYMIDSDVYAIYVGSTGCVDSPVIGVCSGHRRVADNFTDFLFRFLNDRHSLF